VTTATIYLATGIALAIVGFTGMAASRSWLRRILALNVMSSGVFLLFVAPAARAAGPLDPVPQALVLTGIVVAVSATALALGLARRAVAAVREDPPVHGSRA
jgi:multicomponent Na+:H+ antiporter subunit C